MFTVKDDFESVSKMDNEERQDEEQVDDERPDLILIDVLDANFEELAGIKCVQFLY